MCVFYMKHTVTHWIGRFFYALSLSLSLSQMCIRDSYNMAYMGMVILLLAAFAATSTIREHEAAEGNVFSTCN